MGLDWLNGGTYALVLLPTLPADEPGISMRQSDKIKVDLEEDKYKNWRIYNDMHRRSFVDETVEQKKKQGRVLVFIYIKR